ncbi:Copper transport outer membrane protein, MctB [Klenkia soli]|uniref:Copper transport outer membrane protein, MctB n=1 Tax=Klenkia soli TaxID=1052260 RepID=A0A1H0GSY8_9ACTN|nr:copper transporter [Klenkia soli]SDO09944.1 Copper transport outer membrane protein, MctB [Klenkia soli]
MIDFRYHLVSLIAVFLAVALGIVIGTTALNGGLLDNLQTQVSGLQEDKRSLEDTNQGLQAQLDSTGGFAEEVGPALVAGTLTGRSVLLVVGNEDVDTDAVDEITSLLGDAGATVNGTVRLNPAYSDPGSASSLQNYLATQGALPAGVELPTETSDTGELVASLLAQVLMIPRAAEGSTSEAPATTATAQVLGGLSTLGVLTQDSASVVAADYAIFLTSGSLTGDDAAERNATLVQLVTALDRQGSGTVVSGDAGAAADGGLVGTIRADTEASTLVSTVDNANAPEGRISTVLALSTEGEGTSGKFGTGDDAQPVPPIPATAGSGAGN